MVPVVSVRVAGAPPAAAAGVMAGAVAGAAAEEAGVEADVTLPLGRPQERLQRLRSLWLYLPWRCLLGQLTTLTVVILYLLWLQEWLQLLLAQLAAVASGEYIPLALRHGDCPP